MSEYKYLHHLKNHASSGIITKDGHTMFLQDVVEDIKSLTQRNTELENKYAELVEAVRKHYDKSDELQSSYSLYFGLSKSDVNSTELLRQKSDCERECRVARDRVTSLIEKEV